MPGRADPAGFVAALSGSHRFILGYLTEEVLARQPAEIQEFLLQTSILGQFCAEVCDAVLGIGESVNRRISNPSTPFADSQAVLAALERANVFLISLDDEGRWYRYHHLFAELLQAQLRRRSPGLVAELHRRASRWHEAQEMPAEAINHALAAGEHGRVVALLERHGWALLNGGYTHTLEGWLRALPADLAGSSPRISLDFGWARLLRGALDQVGPLLAQAEAALDARVAAGAAALRAECLALRANLLQALGRAAEAIAAAECGLALTSAADHRLIGLASLALGGAYRQAPDFERAVAALQRASQAAQAAGDRVTDMLAVAHLTLMATQYGRLRLAAEAATAALQRLAHEHAAPPPIIGAVYGALGLIHYQWNDLELAQEHLRRGIRLGTLTGHSASVIYSQCNLARLLQAGGDLAGAAQALDAAGRLLAQGAPGWVRPELIDRQVSLALATGDLAAADARLRESGVSADDPVTHHTDPIHLAWLRLLLARGDARAAGLAQRIIRSAEAGGRHGTLLHALILAARRHADEPRVAAAYLERALALAEPEGSVRVFLDEGEANAALLGRVGCPPWLAQHLPLPLPSPQPPPCEGGGATISPSPDKRGGQGGEIIEPLSERELEVLRLLAEGLTYAEIAGRLVVSLNTVRFHVKEIYGKLGVNRQAQAVARARELGWL
jgi:LuxR family maltose regulon positive regulatory protein